MEKFLSQDDIETGIRLTGVNPLEFYTKRESGLGYRDPKLVCSVCNLGAWQEGTSYYQMYEKAFGLEGAEFIHNLPALINWKLQN